MNDKFYVSLEAARLLKEKGYNEKVEKAYVTMNDGNTIKVLQVEHNNKELPELCYSCPTKSEAIDWLERKIIIGIGYDNLFSKWHYDITPVRTGTKEINNLSFSTRLEAEDAAIIKACELL